MGVGVAMICDNCRWWDYTTGETGEVGGYCRINPPRAAHGREEWGYWPVTKPVDWCGRYLTNKVRKAKPGEVVT